jgi:PST family polysaccharide transporter
VAATPLVRLVYGAQWVPAGPVLRWLAVAAALRIMFELAYDYLVVLARTGAVLRVQVLWLAALAPAVWLGCAAGGGVGAAVAMVAVAGAVVLPAYLIELSRAGVPLPR